MKSRILMSVLVIVVAVSMVVGGTMAWFTDSEVSNGNTFTAGTLKLDVNSNGSTGSYAIANLTVGNMAPGDLMNESNITISNTGSLPLAWVGRWIMSGNATMQEYIYIDSMQMEFLKPGAGTWEPTDKFITNGVGSGTYASYINDAKDTTLGVITLKKWISTNGAGMMPGSIYQNMGALKPGYQYRLTFKLGLHTAAPNAAMGQTVGIAYQVDATQIKDGALKFSDVTWYNQQIAKQVP